MCQNREYKKARESISTFHQICLLPMLNLILTTILRGLTNMKIHARCNYTVMKLRYRDVRQLTQELTLSSIVVVETRKLATNSTLLLSPKISDN